MKCPQCATDNFKQTNQRVHVDKYDADLHLYCCSHCRFQTDESQLFGQKEWLLEKYGDPKEIDIEEPMDDDWGEAFDEWQHDSLQFLSEMYDDLQNDGFAVIKTVTLDYYGMSVEEITENLNALYDINISFEWFGKYAYRIKEKIESEKTVDALPLRHINSPINWYGGKYAMAADLIELFPKHKIYCEVFGGSAKVLFRKEPSPIEVYNDLHEGLYLFFSYLRNEEKSQRLAKALSLTLYSRQEFQEAKSWINESDELEKVRKFYIATMQSVNCNGGWSRSTPGYNRSSGMADRVTKWLSHIDRNLPDAVDRLRQVQVENRDFRQLIEMYDSPSTLFYLDPPYVASTRKQSNNYLFEMTDDDHGQLVDTLLKIKGKAVLSGYNNDIYDKLKQYGWYCKQLGTYNKNTSKEIAEEFVWLNYKHTPTKTVQQLNLLNVSEPY